MNYLIIGGVAGGATVAARLRRMDEKANIILFERGKYVSYANCGLPYLSVTRSTTEKSCSYRQQKVSQTVSGLTFARNRR